MPNQSERVELLNILFCKTRNIGLNKNEIIQISKLTHGYSCCDITSVCREAKMIANRQITTIGNAYIIGPK